MPDADPRRPQPAPSASDICRELQWDDPGTSEALADRWVKELDAHGVTDAQTEELHRLFTPPQLAALSILIVAGVAVLGVIFMKLATRHNYRI